MPLSRDEIASAARANDDRVDQGEALAAVLTDLGVDPQSAIYVADQRALRVALLFEGWTRSELALMAQGMKPRRVKLSPEQVAYMPIYSGIWIDGFAAGVQACHTKRR
jgi:hypothetical protein